MLQERGTKSALQIIQLIPTAMQKVKLSRFSGKPIIPEFGPFLHDLDF